MCYIPYWLACHRDKPQAPPRELWIVRYHPIPIAVNVCLQHADLIFTCAWKFAFSFQTAEITTYPWTHEGILSAWWQRWKNCYEVNMCYLSGVSYVLNGLLDRSCRFGRKSQYSTILFSKHWLATCDSFTFVSFLFREKAGHPQGFGRSVSL